jgi:hypothetical protein
MSWWPKALSTASRSERSRHARTGNGFRQSTLRRQGPSAPSGHTRARGAQPPTGARRCCPSPLRSRRGRRSDTDATGSGSALEGPEPRSRRGFRTLCRAQRATQGARHPRPHRHLGRRGLFLSVLRRVRLLGRRLGAGHPVHPELDAGPRASRFHRRGAGLPLLRAEALAPLRGGTQRARRPVRVGPTRQPAEPGGRPGRTRTGHYRKVCAADLESLVDWCRMDIGVDPGCCGHCHPWSPSSPG